MKRIFQTLLLCVLTLSLLAGIASPVFATELKTAVGVVEAPNGLHLRAKPDTSARILTYAEDGDTVIVIRQDGDWYLVNYNLYIGYVHSDYLTLKNAANMDFGAGSLDPSVTNIRYGPSEEGTKIDELRSGDEVDVIGCTNGWYKVKYDETIGYVRSDLLTLLEKPAANKGTVAPAQLPSDDSSSGNGSYGSSSSDSSSSDSSYSDSSYSDSSSSDSSYSDSSSSDSSSSGSSSSGSSSSGSNSSGDSVSSSGSIGQQIATYAQSFVGYPYVYGGSSPSGFDCSGFMQYVFGQFGYRINRTATAQLQNGYYVSYDEMQPGDIIYFGSGSSASHVGLYIGNGNFVHAQSSATGVVISSLSESYYAGRYLCAHRIAE